MHRQSRWILLSMRFTGTWSASGGIMGPSNTTGWRAFKRDNTNRDSDVWFSYRRNSGAASKKLYYVLRSDGNKKLQLAIHGDKMVLEQQSADPGSLVAVLTDNDPDSTNNVWYDMRVRCDGPMLRFSAANATRATR